MKRRQILKAVILAPLVGLLSKFNEERTIVLLGEAVSGVVTVPAGEQWEITSVDYDYSGNKKIKVYGYLIE